MSNSIKPSLSKKLDPFLNTVRLGIDFGEDTAGVAVVHGNKILGAVSIFDSYGDTLEKRRQNRRGRRSRKAKKHRLARLRSWVFRQAELRDKGKAIDLHDVLLDPQMFPKSGVFRAKGADPVYSPDWIKKVTNEGGSSREFVKALSLIFQKRGFYWEEDGLSEWTDSEILESLKEACLTLDSAEAENFKAEIKYREENPDDPRRKKGAKGKPEPFNKLWEALNGAIGRERKPRTASPRTEKSDELRALIAGYCKKAGLSLETMERWQIELATTPQEAKENKRNTGLLWRIIRPARFENRLKSGCSWCGESTPKRKSDDSYKYKALRGALVNCRPSKEKEVVLEVLTKEPKIIKDELWKPKAPGRKMDQEELTAFFEFLTKLNEEGKPPSKARIETKLRNIGAQEKMANQLHDLIANKNPKGRYNLCKTCLEKAEKGEQPSNDMGMVSKAKRGAPNPCREAHEKRLIKVIEGMLFDPTKTGPESYRYSDLGPVMTITLEVPEPGGEERRAKKGEQKERHLESLKERLLKEQEGVCLYTGEELTASTGEKEHTWPRSLGGPDVQFNLTLAHPKANEEKDNRSPYQWFGSNSAKWGEFRNRINQLVKKGLMHPRKAAILLNESDEYPENKESALTRIGQRHRTFASELAKLFADRGLPIPQEHFQIGKPLIQVVRGRFTDKLRRSWEVFEDTTDNFMPKNPGHAHNHAEDAAILAACPPHTWREQIFIEGLRRNFQGELKSLPDTAVKTLAPDWQEFMRRKTKPIVRFHFPKSGWVSNIDLTFCQDPMKTSGELKQRKSLAQLDNIPGKLPIIDQNLRQRVINQAKTMSLPEGQGKKLGEAFLTTLGVEGKYPRRVTVKTQAGGYLFSLKPQKGPIRKIQIKNASEGVVVWELETPDPKGKKPPKVSVEISVIRPIGMTKLPPANPSERIPRHDPPVPKNAKILGKIRKNEWIYLEEEKGSDGKIKRRAGWYWAKEFSKSGIKMMPEWGVSKPAMEKVAKEKNIPFVDPEISLGKTVLAEYFRSAKTGKGGNHES